MPDPDHPGPAAGRLAVDPQVAPEVDAGAGSARGPELGDQQVGGMALADPARVETDPGGQGDRRPGRIDHHPVPAPAERRHAARASPASRSKDRS
jgi:hypothetical protein